MSTPVSFLAFREDKVHMHLILLIAGKKKGDSYLHSEYGKHSLDRIRVYVARGIEVPAFFDLPAARSYFLNPFRKLSRPGASICPPAPGGCWVWI